MTVGGKAAVEEVTHNAQCSGASRLGSPRSSASGAGPRVRFRRGGLTSSGGPFTIHKMNADSLTDSNVIQTPRRERERQQRRQEILRAAERIFAARGFHDASIEQIAHEAEFATGTVYLYFKDKEALYLELFEEKIRELSETIRRELEPIKDPLEGLATVIRARMGYFERNRAFFRIYAREGMNRYEQRHDRWQNIMQMYEQYLERLRKLIQSAQRRGAVRKGDPHLFAIALSGMMIQVTRDWLQSQDETPLTERTQFVIDLFFGGARPAARHSA